MDVEGMRKVKLKVKFNLERVTKAQRGSRDTTLFFFNLGTRWCVWSTSRPDRFTNESPGTHL